MRKGFLYCIQYFNSEYCADVEPKSNTFLYHYPNISINNEVHHDLYILELEDTRFVSL